MKKILLLISVFSAVSLFSQSIGDDQSYLDDDFWLFKMNLANCIIKKDTTALSNLLYDKVLDCWDAYGCAGKNGCPKEQFINTFFGDEKSKEWDVLKKIVQFGFYRRIDSTKYEHVEDKMDKHVFQGPSFSYNNWQPSKILVLAENLNVRAAPSTDSKVLTTVSYGEYNSETEETGYISIFFGDKMEWVKIYLKDGTVGYVAKKFTSEFIDRTLTVGRINGNWKIISYYCHLNI